MVRRPISSLDLLTSTGMKGWNQHVASVAYYTGIGKGWLDQRGLPDSMD